MTFWIGFMLGASANAVLVLLFTFLQERRQILAHQNAPKIHT